MPIKRNSSKKGRLSGTARKELNMTASHAVVDKAVVGTNEDTVFGRITKIWGNGHCEALVQHGGVRVTLHKVRIPKNRLGKKGSTPINTSTVVSIFVGKDFNAAQVRAADQFDITSILDDKQVRMLVKEKVAPSWFMKTVDELASGVGMGAVAEEEAWEWDASDDAASSSEEEAVAAAALARIPGGKAVVGLGDALTKKQLREVKKAVTKVKPASASGSGSKSDSSDDEDGPIVVEAEDSLTKSIAAEESAFMAKANAEAKVEAKKVAEAKSSAWSDFGAWRSSAPASAAPSAPSAPAAVKASDAWIDNI